MSASPAGRPAPDRAAGPVPDRGTGRARVAALVALLLLAGLLAAGWTARRPSPPVPATAPPGEFSAERALAELREIAPPWPTPTGSAAGDRVRDHLVARLGALGWAVEIQRGVGVRARPGGVDAGQVENVVATLRGRDPTGRVVLAAHYDTAAGSPGASDDKAGVAAILEVGRALAAGGSPRNDVVVLLTDGEEPGLLGATAFVTDHPLGRAGGVVVNLEAVGNAGPSVLFETGPGTAALVDALAGAAPRPAGDSATAALYALADAYATDFTVLRDAGFTGLNLALLDGTAHYHSAVDVVERLDPASVQHHGETLLALARALAERDLGRPLTDPAADAGATWLDLPGGMLRYPGWAVAPLAAAALAAVAGLAALGRRRGLLTVPRALAGVALAVVPLVAAPALAAGMWELLVAVRPGYSGFLAGDPYRPGPYRWAIGVLTVAVVLGWYAAVRVRVGPAAVAVGALAVTALLGVAAAVALPGAAFLGSLPALGAAAGGIAAVLAPRWRAAALAAAAVPGIVVLVPVGHRLLGIVGLAGGAAAAVLFALAGLLLLPLLELVRPPRAAPAVALVAAGALVATGLAVDRFDAAHPAPSHLLLAHDAATGRAWWLSEDAHPDPWTAGYVPDAAGASDLPLPYGTRPRWSGPAPVPDAEPPRLQVLGSRTEGGTTVVDLVVTSPRGAGLVALHADRPVEHVTVPGAPGVAVPAPRPGRAWPFELRFHAPPPEGVRVTLRVRGTGSVRIACSDATVGLGVLRPPGLMRSPAHDSDLVVVGRVHVL